LLLIWIIKSHVLYRGYSIKRALSIVQSANIVDDLFEMLTEYGFINASESATLSKNTLSRTLERLSVVDDRTAQRHFSAGVKLLSSVLGAYLPALSRLISPEAAPDHVEMPTESLDIAPRLTQFASTKFQHAPAVSELLLPMQKCSSLPVRVNDVLLESKNLLNHIAGRSGTIMGSRGSGRTTLMMALAASSSRGSSGKVYYYVSAPDYLPYAQQGLGYEQLIVDQLLGDDVTQKDSRASLLAQVEDLERNGRVMLLVDNFDSLPISSQELMLWQLSKTKSIYFSALPWTTPKIDASMQKYGFPRDLLKIELADLDFPRINEMCNTAYRLMGVENPPQNTAAYIRSQLGKSACTPLAVIAASQASVAGNPRVEEYPAKALVSELLRRDGLADVPIPGTLDKLDAQLGDIIRLGKAVRNCIELEPSYDWMDDDPENREPVWMPMPLLQENFGVSMDTIANWHVFEFNEPGNSVRFYCRAVEEHIAAISCYYLGSWKRTILDRLLVGLKASAIARILCLAESWSRLDPTNKNDNARFENRAYYV
jgi:type II secretory pathway predicted ATPase ExeA